MGFNTVAVLLNDGLHMGADDPELGKRIQEASRNWGHSPQRSDADIFARSGRGSCSYGSIVSVSHADDCQIVIAGGNMGFRIQDAKPQSPTQLSTAAIWLLQEALERHGYSVTKRRKTKKSTR